MLEGNGREPGCTQRLRDPWCLVLWSCLQEQSREAWAGEQKQKQKPGMLHRDRGQVRWELHRCIVAARSRELHSG